MIFRKHEICTGADEKWNREKPYKDGDWNERCERKSVCPDWLSRRKQGWRSVSSANCCVRIDLKRYWKLQLKGNVHLRHMSIMKLEYLKFSRSCNDFAFCCQYNYSSVKLMFKSQHWPLKCAYITVCRNPDHIRTFRPDLSVLLHVALFMFAYRKIATLAICPKFHNLIYRKLGNRDLPISSSVLCTYF